jgi:hypothetical protein
MTYRWTPTSGCSTSTPCATDQVSGNNASQTTSGDLPTYSATGGPNSTPSLAFNGTSDFIIPATAIPSGLTVFTLYVILNVTTLQDGAMFGGVGGGIEYRIDSSGKPGLLVQSVVGTSGTQTLSTGTWYTVVVTHDNGTTTTNFYNATSGTLSAQGNNTTQAMVLTSTTNDLGGATGNSEFFNGEIAEWGYLNSVNTAGIAAWSNCHYGV